MEKKKLLSLGLPLAAVVAGLVGITIKFLSNNTSLEVAIGALSIILALIVGALSGYLARVSKHIGAHPRVFLSYSHDNKEAARSLQSELQKLGAVVWFDEDALRPGENISGAIDSAIESSNTMIAMISSGTGGYMARELKEAIARNVPVLAVVQTGSRSPNLGGLESRVRVLASSDPATIALTALGRVPV